MRRTKLTSLLTAAVAVAALLPCAAAKTLYWTGQSSDEMPTTWLLGYAWSENSGAPIGDCEFTQADDLVFSSSAVDNTESLTNYDKWNDCWHPVVVHSVTFNSYVSFGFARIEVTQEGLVAEGVGRKDDYDAFGKWASARVTWAGGTVEPGAFDADECLTATFSYTDMNGDLRRKTVEHVTTRTVEFEVDIPDYSTYYMKYRDTTLEAIRSEAGKYARLFNTLVVNDVGGHLRELALGDESGLTLEVCQEVALTGDCKLGALRIAASGETGASRVDIAGSLTIGGLQIARRTGGTVPASMENGTGAGCLDFSDDGVVLQHAAVSLEEPGCDAGLGTVKDSSITVAVSGSLAVDRAENVANVSAASGGTVSIGTASGLGAVTARSGGTVEIGALAPADGETSPVGSIGISDGGKVTVLTLRDARILTRDLSIDGGSLYLFDMESAVSGDPGTYVGSVFLDEDSCLEVGAGGATVVGRLVTEAYTDERGKLHSAVLDFSAGGMLTLGGYVDAVARSAELVPGFLDLAPGTVITLSADDYRKVVDCEAVNLMHVEGGRWMPGYVELMVCNKDTAEIMVAKGYMGGGGTFFVLPEPATATLGLFALAWLAARRKCRA